MTVYEMRVKALALAIEAIATIDEHRYKNPTELAETYVQYIAYGSI